MFQNRRAVLATRHQKERVIGPVLQTGLGLTIHVPPDFDSDRFGTFTREIPRLGNQLQAARQKALAAMEATGMTLGLASEGSFGPHPIVPFAPGNIELLVFIDRERDLEIIGQAVSADTNFSHRQVSSRQDALSFAAKAGFPEHGLVVYYHSQAGQEIIKGLVSKPELIQTLDKAFDQAVDGKVFLETDMRAHYNPTRMTVIHQAAVDLLEKLNSFCPACQAPGFVVAEAQPGLPCAQCEMPSQKPIAIIYRCPKCLFEEHRQAPGPATANPAECLICNP